GPVPVRGRGGGTRCFEALVRRYPSDALRRHTGFHVEFFGHLRSRRLWVSQSESRFHIPCCSLRVMAADYDRACECRFDFWQVVIWTQRGERRRTALAVPSSRGTFAIILRQPAHRSLRDSSRINAGLPELRENATIATWRRAKPETSRGPFIR